MRDAGTAVMDNLVVPLNQKAGPAIKEFADAAAGSTQKLSSGRVVTTPQANNLAVKQGMYQPRFGSICGARSRIPQKVRWKIVRPA
jgi:hypothetical protein